MIVFFVILAMFFLLLSQGFFSGSEIALVHADKLKLQHRAGQGHSGSKLILKMFQRPELILGTTLVGTNLSLVALTTLGTILMIRFFGEVGELYAILIYTPLFLIFGEVVPKSIYQQLSDRMAPVIIYPLWVFSRFFYPVVYIFSRLSRWIAKIFGVKPPTQKLFVKREQIRHLLEMSEQGANIDVFDRDRIMRVVRFAEKTAGDSMIPMAEMTVIDHKSTTRKALRMAYQKGHFRLPVFEGKATNITGVVSFTLWNLMDPQLAQLPLADLVKPVHFITPHQLLDELLPELQKREDHMVIVVDEFGSAIGMLTLEDVLEEVTGEVINVGFNFEAQVARHAYQIENPQEGVFIMDARTPIVEVAEALNTPLSSAKAHTIGGMVTATLRHIPKPGESVLAGNFRFVVVQANERSVIQIRAEIIGG